MKSSELRRDVRLCFAFDALSHQGCRCLTYGAAFALKRGVDHNVSIHPNVNCYSIPTQRIEAFGTSGPVEDLEIPRPAGMIDYQFLIEICDFVRRHCLNTSWTCRMPSANASKSDLVL